MTSFNSSNAEFYSVLARKPPSAASLLSCLESDSAVKIDSAFNDGELCVALALGYCII